MPESSFRVNLAWGRHGVQQAAARGDVIVIVDTLSFSSSVATAIAYRGEIYPCSTYEEAIPLAEQFGAELAVHRSDVPGKGRFSLSPWTYVAMPAGTRVVLPSPNGATLCRLAAGAREVIVGCSLNAAVVAIYVAERLEADDSLCATVVAAGERYHQLTADGELRFALEDYLGAGAIISWIDQPKSPEAAVCAAAFTANQGQLTDLLRDCESGRELRDKGYPDDVRIASWLYTFSTVPILEADGWIRGRVE